MSKWHKLEVGDGVEALQPSMKLNEAFFGFAKAGATIKNMGVFSYYDLGANMVTWYFSPETSMLAESFGAIPCEKPIPEEGFGLLVGDGACWATHFPEYIARRHAR